MYAIILPLEERRGSERKQFRFYVCFRSPCHATWLVPTRAIFRFPYNVIVVRVKYSNQIYWQRAASYVQRTKLCTSRKGFNNNHEGRVVAARRSLWGRSSFLCYEPSPSETLRRMYSNLHAAPTREPIRPSRLVSQMPRSHPEHVH